MSEQRALAVFQPFREYSSQVKEGGMIWIPEMDQEDVCRSNTQRNYAPFTSESNVSAVSPRAFAFRPTSSRISASDAYSPAASSRIDRLNKAQSCVFPP